MNAYQYQLIAVNQSLYTNTKIIFEIRSDSGFTIKLPALEVAHNAVLMENLSPADIKRVIYFAGVLENAGKTKKASE
jgi:hypothetical protein